MYAEFDISLVTGNSEIDDQHKEWIDKINNLLECCENGGGKREAIKIMQDVLTPEEYKGFLKGLIIKYLYRADKKNGAEDYKKAQWYMDELVKTVEKEK